MGSDKILSFLNPNSNDKLCELSDNDLKELLLLLDEFYLSMREKLDVNRQYTFGIEFEFELLYKDKLLDNVKKNVYIPNDIKCGVLKEIRKDIEDVLENKSYKVEEEHAIDMGGEITSPILRDSVITWYDIETVCNILKSYNADASRVSSHIHICSNILGDDVRGWLNFIKIWSCYEDVINRFLYGELLTERSQLREYARPLARYMMLIYNSTDILLKDVDANDVLYSLTSHLDRNVSVNLINIDIPVDNENVEGSTIEFRTPNGTINPIIWQNNVNFLMKLLMYAKSFSFDSEIMKKYYQDDEWMCDLNYYSKVHLKKALELADLIFDNNLDKIYFLRQYTKSFEIGYSYGEKAKQFTL